MYINFQPNRISRSIKTVHHNLFAKKITDIQAEFKNDQTDRQTGRQAGRQTDRHTDRQTDGRMDRRTGGWKDNNW